MHDDHVGHLPSIGLASLLIGGKRVAACLHAHFPKCRQRRVPAAWSGDLREEPVTFRGSAGDFREGVEAFGAKRKPRFRGNDAWRGDSRSLRGVAADGGPRDAMGRTARKWQLRRCINRWSAAMPQPNDLSRSLVALDQNSTIIAVVELSQSSWLVAGVLPGIERQPYAQDDDRRAGTQAAHRALALCHDGRDTGGRRLTSSGLKGLTGTSRPLSPIRCSYWVFGGLPN